MTEQLSEHTKRRLTPMEYYGISTELGKIVGSAESLVERLNAVGSPDYAAAILHLIGPDGALFAGLKREMESRIPQIMGQSTDTVDVPLLLPPDVAQAPIAPLHA